VVGEIHNFLTSPLTLFPGAHVAESPQDRQELVEFARRVLIMTMIVVGVLLLVVLLWYATWVLLLLFAGILLAVALRAVSDQVQRITGLGSGWSLMIVLVVLAGLATLGGWLAFPFVVQQVNQLVAELPQSLQTIREWLLEYEWGRWLLYWSPPADMMENGLPQLLWQATGLLYSTFGAVVAVVVVLFVGLYLAGNASYYTTGVLRLVPMTYRPRMAEIMGVLGITLRRWLMGQVMGMTYVGVTTFIGLWLLDVPLALILALVALLLEFVPYVGPIVASIPAIMIAFVQSPQLALWVLLLYVGIQQLESYVVMPLIQRRAVKLPPVLTISAQVLLGLIVGPLGLVLATPLTAVSLVLVKMLYVEDTLGDRVEAPETELKTHHKPTLPEPSPEALVKLQVRKQQTEILTVESQRQAELKERYKREGGEAA